MLKEHVLPSKRQSFRDTFRRDDFIALVASEETEDGESWFWISWKENQVADLSEDTGHTSWKFSQNLMLISFISSKLWLMDISNSGIRNKKLPFWKMAYIIL